MGGFKFAIQGSLKPVYRRPRFDYGEGLLSGPAWAGVLAVLAARRNALRAWLGEGAVRSVMVGALAAGLGVQAGTTPSVAQNAAKGHANPCHSSAARQATGGGGLAAGISRLSESDGDNRADARNIPAATEPAAVGVRGGQGWRPPVPRMGAAQALGERIDVLSDFGLFDLFGAVGPSSSSGRPGNDGSPSDSGEPGSASESSALGSSASISSGLPSYDVLPGPGGFFGWQAGSPIEVLAGGASSGSIDIASGSGPDIPPESTRAFEDLHGRGQGGGGSADLGAAGPSGGLPASLGAPGPGGISEAFPVPSLVSGGSEGLGGVSVAFRAPGLVSGGSRELGGVPEPATWAIMLVGLTLVGGAARQRRARPDPGRHLQAPPNAGPFHHAFPMAAIGQRRDDLWI